MLSEEASFMVLDMLRQNPRPDDADRSRSPAACRSIGRPARPGRFRDAWTAGIFGPYVLVVWVGNFDGSGNPAFVGVDAAAPLFFQIADALRARDPNLAEPAHAPPKH